MVLVSQSSAATDQLCRALSHPTRRRALGVLADAEASLTARDVAHELVSDEFDDSHADDRSADSESVLISLIHVHLPALADATLIEYDPASQSISAIDIGDVRPLLDRNVAEQLPEPSQQ